MKSPGLILQSKKYEECSKQWLFLEATRTRQNQMQYRQFFPRAPYNEDHEMEITHQESRSKQDITRK